MELRVEEAGHQDVELLADMNRQLIEDEGHDHPLEIPKLKIRMEALLRGGYRAYLFMQGEEVRGRVAFGRLLEILDTGALDVEVLSWNKRGQAFWKSLGFAERSVYLRREGGMNDVTASDSGH
ncbi:hypothetical protein F4V43_09350 [Paenibacillus spiritus]|uniref:GNAT family N-acetyltransferase n=1 Tax=Paenibacillus spiritus TaxID=2496557 RepID=A0A5J5GA49_9BACL|nr:hypothetical protein [Paenibacillus spiritus]KAA9004830.1 hypothetical protein F4V43_09350 [Paenibacillus spiritus]